VPVGDARGLSESTNVKEKASPALVKLSWLNVPLKVTVVLAETAATRKIGMILNIFINIS
jgi:hypothetical protein